MSVWPLYRESLLQGPSHVSLSLPGKPSAISKSVGGTSPALLLIPNMDYLQSFVKGNVGIGDSAIKGMLSANLNSPIAMKEEKVAKSFIDANKMDIPDINKFKKPSGEIKIPVSEIVVPPAFNGIGIKGLEKTLVTSIFETQKPFIDITKNILGVMVNIEDIVARIMPVLSLNPLTSKSEKPIVKSGNSNGTKAIGYQNGVDFKKVLAELEKISTEGGKLTVNKDGTTSKDTKGKRKTNYNQGDVSGKSLEDIGKKWKIISVVYSTGEFDPMVNYEYIYNNIPGDENPLDKPGEADADEGADNPYDKYKPKRLIFGLFNSKGIPMNPMEKLKTVSLNGNTVTKVYTDYDRAGWVNKSPKWKFRNGEYIWPSFGSGDSGKPVYLWEGPLGITTESKTSPGDKWSIKRYKKGDKNIINKIEAAEGDPYIVRFDSNDSSEFTNYFRDYLKSRAKANKDLDQGEKDAIVEDIMGKLDVQSHLQNVFLYGSGANSYYREPGIPEPMKKSLKPYQIYVPEAATDPLLSGDGLVWIDPEADYEFKVIRVDPTMVIDYKGAKGEPVVSAKIKSFVKNKVVFKLKEEVVQTTLSGGASKNPPKTFRIVVEKNGSSFDTKDDQVEYVLENWNYENQQVNNQNVFRVKIYDKQGNLIHSKKYDSSNLPSFGTSRQILIDPKGFIPPSPFAGTTTTTGNTGAEQEDEINGVKITETDEKIPIVGIKVENSNGKDGIVINPDAISNDSLATAELFSNGTYGNGTQEAPQELEILKRFSLTDLDTESYYIIEGILIDDNNGAANNANASGDNGSKWYRLPHAIGAIIPFLKMLMDLSMKMFPNIAKLLKLFKDPTKFITDTITEKLGESFDIFSEPAMDKFKRTKDIISKKKEIIDNGSTSDYSSQIKNNFNTSPLSNHVDVDEYSLSNPGKFKFLLDGTAMIPFEIFGKSIPFGMELKMSNLVPQVPNINSPSIGVPKVDVPKIPDTKEGLTSAASSASAPKVEVPNVGAPSLTLPKVQSPFKLIVGPIGKAKSQDCDGALDTPDNTGKTKDDYLNDLNGAGQGQDQDQGNKRTESQNKYFVETTVYSTGVYIEGVDYNYYYVTIDQLELINKVDELINSGGESSRGASNATDADRADEVIGALPEDLNRAKELLQDALKKDPSNQLLKDKLSEVNAKILDLMKSTQPILKMVLGLVAAPVKVVACVVQWILNFFKSILNPMMLPSKIIEFLSFSWIKKFFGAEGLLKTAGVSFNPALAKEWASLANIPNPDAISAAEAARNSSELGSKAKSVSPQSNVEFNKGVPVKRDDVLSKIPKHNGKYAIPDTYPFADMQKFMNISFMASLPTYTTRDIRENPNIPETLLKPTVCMIEKFINAFIDFVWSLLGIEVVIPPPHIKMCKDKDPEDVNRNNDGNTKQNVDDGTTEVISTVPFEEKPISDSFVYVVTFEDGKKQQFKDYEALQAFIDENKDIGFDLNI